MVPTRSQCYKLWDNYNLPPKKRIHSELIAKVAYFLGIKLIEKEIPVNLDLLMAASLLHDIDKNVPKRKGLPAQAGERHPDTAVRILQEEGMEEVAGVVARHSLHLILNPGTAPQSWEEKLLYLSDKMVKQEIIGVEARFALWRAEQLPPDAVRELDASYPKVKALEKEVLSRAQVTFEEIKKATILSKN